MHPSAMAHPRLAPIFHGATAPSPWFARKPQRGRCGSSKPFVMSYHSECEMFGLGGGFAAR